MKRIILVAAMMGLMMPAAFSQQDNKTQKVKEDDVKTKVKDNDRREKAKVKVEDERGIKSKQKMKDKKNDTLPPKITPDPTK
jgi:Ni/Co efflux regulator RcnB